MNDLFEDACPCCGRPYQQEVAGTFDDFWAIYPRKVGKLAAQKAYAKAVKSAPHKAIMDAASAFEIKSRGKEAEFIPHPATWLNAGRWLDDVEVKAPEVKDDALRQWADWINGDVKLFTYPRRETVEALIAAKLVTPDRMAQRLP